MQYRFKYRFFDVENEKMYDVKNICFVGEPTVTVAYKPVIKKAIYRGYLIQCTGLRDKNGKLIYQEDIVRDISTQTVYKVSHKKCAFYLENEEYIGYFHELSQCFSISRLEVIGNIYENPDLLKVA